MAGSGVVAQAAVKFGHRSAEQKRLFGHLVRSVKIPCSKLRSVCQGGEIVGGGRICGIGEGC